MKYLLIAVALMIIGGGCSNLSGFKVSELKTESRINPLGIDVKTPRLSWIVESGKRGEKQNEGIINIDIIYYSYYGLN